MPRKKWIDKGQSTTFQLVHRPQNDPKIHDEASSSMVFQEVVPSQSHKIKSRQDLENELFGESEGISATQSKFRGNEGEAAEHGIYYDDTEYDYMQHIRDLDSGDGDGEIHFVEAPKKGKDGKGKEKVNLEDALRESSLQEKPGSHTSSETRGPQLLDDDLLPTKQLKEVTYQDQQDVPDTLGGFQPDMDPRLREVLEALDDDAYVDDEEEFLMEITKGGKDASLHDFGDVGSGEDGMDDEGWESDETEKPTKEYKTQGMPSAPSLSNVDTVMGDEPDHGDGDWMKEFSKFKQAEKVRKADPAVQSADIQSSVLTGTSATGGRKKKRKGAATSSTGYSMTSSSLVRTEGLNTLDARFEKIEEDYAEDEMDMLDDTASAVTGSSLSSSQAPLLSTRSDFDSIMDDFLDGYSMSGKKNLKKGGHQSGMEQLDEVRRGLGPAKLKTQKA